MNIVYLKFEFYRAILLNFVLNNQLLTKNLLQIMSLKLEDLFFYISLSFKDEINNELIIVPSKKFSNLTFSPDFIHITFTYCEFSFHGSWTMLIRCIDRLTSEEFLK